MEFLSGRHQKYQGQLLPGKAEASQTRSRFLLTLPSSLYITRRWRWERKEEAMVRYAQTITRTTGVSVSSLSAEPPGKKLWTPSAIHQPSWESLKGTEAEHTREEEEKPDWSFPMYTVYGMYSSLQGMPGHLWDPRNFRGETGRALNCKLSKQFLCIATRSSGS